MVFVFLHYRITDKCMLQDLQPAPPPEKTKEEILLFFKLYDPIKEELRYGLLYLFLKYDVEEPKFLWKFPYI